MPNIYHTIIGVPIMQHNTIRVPDRHHSHIKVPRGHCTTIKVLYRYLTSGIKVTKRNCCHTDKQMLHLYTDILQVLGCVRGVLSL